MGPTRSRHRSYGRSTPELRSADLRENPERRLADGQLVELGVDAAQLVAPALVTRLDLDLAERQGWVRHAHRAEAGARRLRLDQEIEVDLDVEDLLHAANVRVAELLVCVEERATPLGAGGRVDDLVAVHLAAPAFDFVLRPEWELARPGRRLLAHAHIRILGAAGRPPQDLTSPRHAGRARVTPPGGGRC